jgi:hypothetical protein
MKPKHLLFISIVLLVTSSIILFSNYNDTVKATKTTQLSIDRNELKECCVYLDQNNEEKTCSIIKEYSCDVCKPKCSSQVA